MDEYDEISECVGSSGVNLGMGVDCVYKGCSCSESCNFITDSSSSCCCKCAYSDGCIQGSYLMECSPPVMECNSNCKCDRQCPNRLTQGKTAHAKLILFQTDGKGWGVKCENDLNCGTYVGEYVGEIISTLEANARLTSIKDRCSCYIIQYREHLDSSRTMTTNIDASKKGNVTRFFNHSCDPNVAVVPVRVNSILPKLCLFTSVAVKAGIELCFSYLGRKVSPITDVASVGSKPCLCGSPNCIGFLPLQLVE